MKQTICYLIIATLAIGLFSCKKSSDTPTPPIVTINGDSTVKLGGLTGALLFNSGDSLTIGFTSTNSTDTASVINDMLNDVATSYNYFYISLAAKSPIVAGTYTTASTNVSSLLFGLRNNGTLYLPKIPSPVVNSVTISAINSTSVSGTYNATIYKIISTNPYTTNGVSINVSGTFKANVL